MSDPIFATSRLLPEGLNSTETTASALTTLLQTVEQTLTGSATTSTTTTVRTILVTDLASYSSLLASESSKTQTTATLSSTASSPTTSPTPSSRPNLALILGLVLGILACFIVACLVALYLLKRKKRKVAAAQSHNVHPSATGTVTETTTDQINQAVEARYAAEKASRMVQVSAQPIDTISIDSREHGRAVVVETIPDRQDNEVHHGTHAGPAVHAVNPADENNSEREARFGFGPAPQVHNRQNQ